MNQDAILSTQIYLQDQEILLAWLTDLHYEEYYELFMSAGYDMPTISRMTPEDLTAIGIKKPNHRKRLKAEITRLNIPDGLPNYIPVRLCRPSFTEKGYKLYLNNLCFRTLWKTGCTRSD